MKLIPLDAVLAEIDRRKQVAFGWMETAPNDAIEAQIELCDDILSFLDSLKVIEVDLDKPFEGVKVQTSMESGSLEEVIVTTKYKVKKGE